MNPKGFLPGCRNVLYLLKQEIQTPLPGFPTDLPRVLLWRALKPLGYFESPWNKYMNFLTTMWSIVLLGNSVGFIKERNLWMAPSVVRLVLENFSVEKYQLLLSLLFYLGCSPPKEFNPWTISSHAAKYCCCGKVIICGEINVQLLLCSEVLYQWFLFPLPLL